MYDLERFKRDHRKDYAMALSEIKNGEKTSHFMWYIFPQMKGLGTSAMADYYGILDIKEAKAFLEDEYLGHNLREISGELLNLSENNPIKIFKYPDNLKLHSCMTLFYHASEKEEDKTLFMGVINKFFKGKMDVKTEKILHSQKRRMF